MGEAVERAGSRRAAWWLALRQESAIWIFGLKAMLAAYITCWIALRLALPHPTTAMVTTVVLANRQSGMVLAKSFYRALGTIIGATVGVGLIGLFGEERVLVLAGVSLWIGACVGGATLNRNFKAYGYILAGYTAALITLTSADHLQNVFAVGVDRLSEVLLGIAVSGVVYEVFMPVRLSEDFQRSLRSQFVDFSAYFTRFLRSELDRDSLEEAHVQFVRKAIAIENLRSSLVFEDPESRVRNREIMLANQYFMAASTSLNSLHHHLRRLERTGREHALSALQHLMAVAARGLQAGGESTRQQLAELDHASASVASAGVALREDSGDFAQQREQLAGVWLLERALHEMRGYATVVDAIEQGRRMRGVERVSFHRGNDYAGALVAMLRTSGVLLALGVFWLATAWTEGPAAMTIAAVFSGFFAAQRLPIKLNNDTWKGFAVGMLVSFITIYTLLNHVDGFLLLFVVTGPLFMAGMMLVAIPSITQIGAGYGIGFLYLMTVVNNLQFDVVASLNGMVSQLLGVGAASVAYMVLPPVVGSAWLRKRHMASMRRQVAMAATAPLPRLASRFESINHDLFAQIADHVTRDSDATRELLAWDLSVHEVGRTVIALRESVAALHRVELTQTLQPVIVAVAALFEAPSAAGHRVAMRALEHAEQHLMREPGDASLRPLLIQLHVLRCALTDREAALGRLQGD